ncbi:site-specific DNA-methyltransferase (adenine-specific) [Glycomyces artemisiae]|uniref:Methyltransferase n=2 Tax=Glycomyces artemisiae TaxID=1076443 RepID=A0A2T0UEV5_9ACTN|nr:site-specific DNA-methyltransferase (adenine-specific) [Glycomyces artemisiae]
MRLAVEPASPAHNRGNRMSACTIHQGDALTVLKSIPTGTVDAVICDPPYNSSAGGGFKAPARDKYVSGDAQHGLADFAGDQRDQRGFTAWLAMVYADCLRAARPGASLLAFTDWRQLPVSSDAIQAGGWIWRGIIPWNKPVNRPKRDGFRASCEYILWATHGEPYRHSPSIYLPGLLTGSQPHGNKRRHITEKPVNIMAELVKIAPEGGMILDPFCGSGSTGEAALAAGRRFTGIEISRHYAGVAAERLGTQTHQP